MNRKFVIATTITGLSIPFYGEMLLFDLENDPIEYNNQTENTLTAFQAKQTIDALERNKNITFSITSSFHFSRAH
ncbi:MAG: hypothetical protein NT144_09010 [Bacteroidia bacterium]|nr:hypothetical protein [Bacteroidia bacterium]